MTKKYNYEKKESGKNDTGRPTDYKPDYCRDIVLFFDNAPKFQEVKESTTTGGENGTVEKYKQIAAPLPTFFAYSRKIGVNGDTLVQWAKDYPEFSAAYNACKELQKAWLTEIALSGLTPPASAIFIMKNVTDYKDKTEADVSIKTYDQISKQKKDYDFK